MWRQVREEGLDIGVVYALGAQEVGLFVARRRLDVVGVEEAAGNVETMLAGVVTAGGRVGRAVGGAVGGAGGGGGGGGAVLPRGDGGRRRLVLGAGHDGGSGAAGQRCSVVAARDEGAAGDVGMRGGDGPSRLGRRRRARLQRSRCVPVVWYYVCTGSATHAPVQLVRGPAAKGLGRGVGAVAPV